MKMVKSVQWFKNGDHPHDACEELTDSDGHRFYSEGRVVRYYRHPYIPGVQVCAHCGTAMHEHGFIDQGSDGQVVCPGDWVGRLETVSSPHPTR